MDCFLDSFSHARFSGRFFIYTIAFFQRAYRVLTTTAEEDAMSFENAYAAVSTYFISAAVQRQTRTMTQEEQDSSLQSFYNSLVHEYGEEAASIALALFSSVDAVENFLARVKHWFGEKTYEVALKSMRLIMRDDFIERVNALTTHKRILLETFGN